MLRGPQHSSSIYLYRYNVVSSPIYELVVSTMSAFEYCMEPEFDARPDARMGWYANAARKDHHVIADERFSADPG